MEGIVALEAAARGSTVVGVDIAPNQIAAAQKRAKELKLEAVATFCVAGAENTNQSAHSFDVVLAGQCWPWYVCVA
jgi:ubiquinone/menaquinone biosynthesis C-methylase UbiE